MRAERRARSASEEAPEAGSRWRKPRAREQRDRWRAPRDPTRQRESVCRDRGREHSGDGRRPDPTKPGSLTGRRGRRVLVAGSGGNSASLTRSRVRGRCRQRTSETMSQARPGANSAVAGRGQRGGVDDRDSTRTARHRTRDDPERKLRDRGESPARHVRSARIVEAGDSPSSEGPPGGSFGRQLGRLPSSPCNACRGFRPRTSWHATVK